VIKTGLICSTFKSRITCLHKISCILAALAVERDILSLNTACLQKSCLRIPLVQYMLVLHIYFEVDIGCNTTWICKHILTFRSDILPLFSGLKVEAVCSSKTFVSTYKITEFYDPEDQHRRHEHENLKYHIILS
jgi:hypothetical protein